MMSPSSNPRVFGVDYQFLSCGDVFTQGLVHAASAVEFPYQHADWNDPDLLIRVHRFEPDLLFVVHGRRFARRGGTRPLAQTAVWLVDEPYETDETASWSSQFDHVFVNDAAALDRHPHASYLPVCYDPHVHRPAAGPKPYAVGFIGGGNTTRDRYLAALAADGLLTYVVGGAWCDAGVNAVCRSRNIAPAATAALYQQTRIVINIFRERHHYNARGTPATALNPRIYEALACGALVVSEWRPEIDALVPELPTFGSEADAVALVRGLIDDPARAETIRTACAARLTGHTYAARLRTVLATCGLALEAAA